MVVYSECRIILVNRLLTSSSSFLGFSIKSFIPAKAHFRSPQLLYSTPPSRKNNYSRHSRLTSKEMVMLFRDGDFSTIISNRFSMILEYIYSLVSQNKRLGPYSLILTLHHTSPAYTNTFHSRCR